MHDLSTLPPQDTRPTILLVEEDDDARPIMKQSLRQHGYRLLVAVDVEDAREWMGGSLIPADLMLVDLVGKTLEEALRTGRELREHAKYDGKTPFVVLPERVTEEMEGSDINLGGNDWVCHYADGEQLPRLLARLLNGVPM